MSNASQGSQNCPSKRTPANRISAIIARRWTEVAFSITGSCMRKSSFGSILGGGEGNRLRNLKITRNREQGQEEEEEEKKLNSNGMIKPNSNGMMIVCFFFQKRRVKSSQCERGYYPEIQGFEACKVADYSPSPLTASLLKTSISHWRGTSLPIQRNIPMPFEMMYAQVGLQRKY